MTSFNSFDESYVTGRVYRLHFGHAPASPEGGQFAQQDIVVTDVGNDHVEGYRASASDLARVEPDDGDDDGKRTLTIYDKPIVVRTAAVVMRRPLGDPDDFNTRTARNADGVDLSDLPEEVGTELVSDGGVDEGDPEQTYVGDRFVVDHAVPIDTARTFVHVGRDDEYHPTGGYWFPSDVPWDSNSTGQVRRESNLPSGELIQYPRDDKPPRIVGKDDLPDWVVDRIAPGVAIHSDGRVVIWGREIGFNHIGDDEGTEDGLVPDGGVTEGDLRAVATDYFDGEEDVETADYAPDRDVGTVVVNREEVDADFGGSDTFDVEDFDDHLRDHGFRCTGYVPAPDLTQVNVEADDGGDGDE